jgi:hypothetical protein
MVDQPIGGDIRTPAAWQLVDLLEQGRTRRAASRGMHYLPDNAISKNVQQRVGPPR